MLPKENTLPALIPVIVLTVVPPITRFAVNGPVPPVISLLYVTLWPESSVVALGVMLITDGAEFTLMVPLSIELTAA